MQPTKNGNPRNHSTPVCPISYKAILLYTTLLYMTDSLISTTLLSAEMSCFTSLSWVIVLTCISIAILPCLSLEAHSFLSNTDLNALLEFKAKVIRDQNGIMPSWNESVHFCQWYGVTCGRKHRRVTSLVLRSSGLIGSLSPYVGNLSFLRVLDLRNNSFSSIIPHTFGNLRRLEVLDLTNNSFSGIIPSNISSCLELRHLGLAGNRLAGEIPNVLSRLSKLRMLSLRRNSLTGNIPNSFQNLTSLQILSVAENLLTGAIPEGLGQLPLQLFSAALNDFSGTAPYSIFNISSIMVFELAGNRIQGNLPSDIGKTMPIVEYFSIAMNYFTGEIPTSLNNCTNLAQLQLSLNNLTGNVPSLEKLDKLEMLRIGGNMLGSHVADNMNFLCTMVNFTGLRILEMSTNRFEGMLPQCIGNLSTNVSEFSADNNKLSGSIPYAFQNLINLEVLDLSSNQFSGHIPSELGTIPKLNMLILRRNNLTGVIPSSFGDLERLTRLYLGGNHLHGSIPQSLGKCKSLEELDVSRNNLTGAIPPQLFDLAALSIRLDLSSNQLTGPLPSRIGNLKLVTNLNFSQNMLSGQIPDGLAHCQSLDSLDLSGNLFEGTIPFSLNSLKALQVLNVSRNGLSGEIPSFLQQLNLLLSLDLSSNSFEGPVPSEGIFTNRSAVSVMGNKKLCGGIPQLQLPSCHFHAKKKRITSSTKIIISSISALLALSFVSMIFLFYRIRNKRQKSVTSKEEENSFLEISYHTLLKATNGFSSANLVGAGSFGSVYKGILEAGGIIVAIKVINLVRQGASKSFLAECEALRNIRHRNLVKILTVCSGIDQAGNDFKALIYEFMSKGSLEQWLHDDTTKLEDSEGKPKNLSLLQRLSVAIDIASALDYLHNQCETQIVHCDLKPSNILLDDHMTAHLGDFGLARFLQEEAQNSLVNETGSIGIRGTIGYAAPEYGMGSEVSTSGDVYSYGILLLEMFTGKRPTDEAFKEGLNLHECVKRALPRHVVGITDPSLLCETQEDPRTRKPEKVEECLISVLEVGVACSAELPKERMSISDVVRRLSSAKDKLVGAGMHGRRHNNSKTPQTSSTSNSASGSA